MIPSPEQHKAALNEAYRAFAIDNPHVNGEEIELAGAIAAYLSALPEQTGERWQPIETAPKDGTHILACDASTRYDAWWTFMQRPPTVVHWRPNPGEEGFYTSVNEVEPQVPFSPTHWRPLPAPPAGESP